MVARGRADVPWFRRKPPFLALADALRRASVDVGGVYVTPLALEHGWLRGATPQRSLAALALAGKPPNPLAPWEPPDVDACLALALQSGVVACGPAAVPVYAAATVRAPVAGAHSRGAFTCGCGDDKCA